MKDHETIAASRAGVTEMDRDAVSDSSGPDAPRHGKRGGHGMLMALCMAAMMGGVWFLLGGTGSEGGLFGSPWILLILAVCPLMHLFMGHGSHGTHDGNETEEK